MTPSSMDSSSVDKVGGSRGWAGSATWPTPHVPEGSASGGGDDDLAEGAGGEGRECVRGLVEGVGVLEVDPGRPVGLVAGGTAEGGGVGVGVDADHGDVFGGELVGRAEHRGYQPATGANRRQE